MALLLCLLPTLRRGNNITDLNFKDRSSLSDKCSSSTRNAMGGRKPSAYVSPQVLRKVQAGSLEVQLDWDQLCWTGGGRVEWVYQ
ncbi:hypothetical protein BJV78DRAFT_498268 [Lactifluus subvellereus]|nr:hypothetical protein BJV78DRAFT_498268 [Lactifluus subvellereus]